MKSLYFKRSVKKQKKNRIDKLKKDLLFIKT